LTAARGRRHGVVRVRRLGPEDAALAAEAVRRVKKAGPAIAEEYLRRLLARPDNLLFVAEEGGAAEGFLLAYALDRVDRDRRMVCLYEIGVAAASRRRGLATGMIEALLCWCREHGVMKTWVVTDRSNEPAMRLYARTGAHPDSGDDVVFVWSEGD
jgi:GNAT superfamily N-acetyltransferase